MINNKNRMTEIAAIPIEFEFYLIESGAMKYTCKSMNYLAIAHCWIKR